MDGMGPAGGAERRGHARVAVRVPVRLLETGETPATGVTTSLSVTGVYVVTATAPRMGADCRVELSLEGYPGPPRVVMEARVARQGANGVGLTFTRMGIREFSQLRNLIRHGPTLAGTDAALRAAWRAADPPPPPVPPEP